jgi:hypothetical protein
MTLWCRAQPRMHLKITNSIQLDFDFTLTKKTIASTLLVFDVEVEVIFKVDFFDDFLSP